MADPEAAAATAHVPAPPAATTTVVTEQLVDPFNVSGAVGEDGTIKAIDYSALVDKFGTQRITPEDIARFEKVTGHKAHRFIRRRIVFSHRDLNMILDRHEKGEPFFLYTGRGPSSDSMHIGHTVPFEFTKYLHDVFDVPLIIMMTDDEKFIFGEKRSIKEVRSYTASNVKDIIAVGFDTKKTFVFSDYGFMGNGGGAFYQNTTRIQKHLNINTIQSTFGFNGSDNVGKHAFACVQGATAFASSFPHIFGEDEEKSAAIPSLIPCAIDQDPYFRLTRDVAPKLNYSKPAMIHARFLDALQGPGSKMSASVDSSAIFMTDTPAQIKNKINRFAFSGGQDTLELQKELGGNPDVDVSFQYLTFFLEDDDELERIRQAYVKGEMLTGELKAICISELQEYVKQFKERRAAVTDDLVSDFFSQKKLECRGLDNLAKFAFKETPALDQTEGTSKRTVKKAEKERQIALRKVQKAEEKAKASN